MLQFYEYYVKWAGILNKIGLINNDCIKEKVEVIPITKKMIKSYFRWFDHVKRRPIEIQVKNESRLDRR